MFEQMKKSRPVASGVDEPAKSSARREKLPSASQRRPTQRDIAAATGMSQTAVSLVLNQVKSSTVSAESRDRILRVAERLGYVPNRMARNLQSARTRALACVIPDITNPAYPALVRGFQAAAEAEGYDTMIFDTDGTLEREKRALNWLSQGHVEAAMAVFFHVNESEVLKATRGRLAIVQIENQVPSPSSHIDKVFIDNAAAARAMTQLLLSRGHRRIALLTCSKGPGPERQRGFRAAMHDAGLSASVIAAEDFTQVAGEHAMASALTARFEYSAVFAANDLLAIGAMSALRAAGLRVPEDVAVAGFDDIPAAQLLQPTLTTVRRSEQEIGRFVAELLISRLDGPNRGRPGGCFEMSFELVSRDSA